MTPDIVDVISADVYKGRTRAGALTRQLDEVSFTYATDYSGPPVATTLPVRSAPYVSGGGAVPAFFAGLLPEGRRLAALQSQLKTSKDDEFSQLIAVGPDCIGDVRVVAPEIAQEREPVIAEDPGAISFREILANEIGDLASGATVPGVQDKISNQMISVPVTRASGPAIIKLSPPGVPLLVENEAFFLDVARACGLELPRSSVITDREGVRGLIVERFDRHRGANGSIESIPQEDAVQLAGRWPSAKYRMSTREVFDAVARVAAAPAVEIDKLVRLFAMSYVVGNGDLHAKNVSVYFTDGLWRVTPAYDVVCTLPYGDRAMALELEGRKDNIRGRDFVAIAGRHGLPERAVVSTLRRVAEACTEQILYVDAIGFDERKNEDIRRVVLKRARDISER